MAFAFPFIRSLSQPMSFLTFTILSPIPPQGSERADVWVLAAYCG